MRKSESCHDVATSLWNEKQAPFEALDAMFLVPDSGSSWVELGVLGLWFLETTEVTGGVQYSGLYNYGCAGEVAVTVSTGLEIGLWLG